MIRRARRSRLELPEAKGEDDGIQRAGYRRYYVLVLLAGGVAWYAVHRVLEVKIDWEGLSHSQHVGGVNEFGQCGWRDPASLLVLRTPKTGSTSLTNELERVAAKTRSFTLEHLPEWPMGVGPIPNQVHRAPPKTTHKRAFRSRLERFVAPESGYRMAYSGHVFLVTVEGTAVIGLAREPQQRLASGFYYVRRASQQTVGACAANATCARRADLGRLCSLHALYFCGYDDDCGLDPEEHVATDVTVDKAIHNLNGSKILLVIPTDRYDDDGTFALRALLPAFFQKAVGIPSAQDQQPYDRRGQRRSPDNHPAKDSRTGQWRLANNPAETESLDRLCRQDMRVFDFVLRMFEAKLLACRIAVTS